MNPEVVLRVIEEQVIKRPLNPAERIVLGQTWNQQTYEQMAEQSGYGDAHLKDTGYKLWREISQALGQRVTKKSLSFVLKEHLKQLSLAAISTNPVETAGSAIHYPSGPLPPDSPLYVERPPYEGIARLAIQRPGGFLRVKAPQKMGKTSLSLRLIQAVKPLSYQVAYLNLQIIDSGVFATTETFLKWFCLRVSQELRLKPQFDDYWDSSMGYKVSSEFYFQEYILEQIDEPIVLFISAAEELIKHPGIAQDFFPLLRYWHEKARWSTAWQKLRLVITHSTEIYVPLKVNQSPFNIGQVMKLPCFTAEQVYELATCYSFEDLNTNHAQRLVEFSGGHPYLVNIFFYYLATQNHTFDSLIKTAATPAGIYGTHLRNYLALLNREPSLAIALREVISSSSGVELDAVTMYQLESLGVIKIRDHRALPSCEIYQTYFAQQLRLVQ
ncbi:MAG: AAA-like domain-containing protein [Cyanobacteria bacterium P01_H01_bin.121]